MSESCRLSELKSGDQAIVLGLSECGRECQNRLIDIGIRPGCRLKMVSGSRGGRVVINSDNGRIALGHGMASKVTVAPTPKH